MTEQEYEIDETFVEITKIINDTYEQLLLELFSFGEYIHDLKIEYQDVDGKTVKCSWQDREKRIEV